MKKIDDMIPSSFSQEDSSAFKTAFLKNLSLKAHYFYKGKIEILPKVPVSSLDWFNLWYTPGVSKISTEIRDDNSKSFDLCLRGNLVAVVSDSTRVLGDGNCTPSGGLGVMEGKAFLMKYLAGVDSFPICIDSRDYTGKHSAEKIIDFVKMAAPSFGAINLEDISQPNCYIALDRLREECSIPVWHDDAQGTACVVLAALINSFKLAEKKISEAKIVFFGAGASNSAAANFFILYGADPANLVIFDEFGSLHPERSDLEKDIRFYRQWELSKKTNPKKIKTPEEAFKNADAVVAFSAPGPHTLKASWIKSMAPKSIVFACANPVPEIYPYEAKEAGAFIVATGRGDFPNQVNNSVCFPGILKGVLSVRANKITDSMAINAAKSIASFSESKGISPDKIIASMDENELFAKLAADTAMCAIKEKTATIETDYETVYSSVMQETARVRKSIELLFDSGIIKELPKEIIDEVFQQTLLSAGKK